MLTLNQSARRPESDATLVAACLRGDDEAWHALVDKYKRLVYSIPLRDRLPIETAEDIFQAVWADLVVELPRIRDASALPHWLVRTTIHKCIKHRLRRNRQPNDEIDGPHDLASPDALPDAVLYDIERRQQLREAVDSLPPRCRQMIQMLFFETPARPYKEVAEQLGLAQGSIGFIRGRCLKRLQVALSRLQT